MLPVYFKLKSFGQMIKAEYEIKCSKNMKGFLKLKQRKIYSNQIKNLISY